MTIAAFGFANPDATGLRNRKRRFRSLSVN
jgi:hypothetical protein